MIRLLLVVTLGTWVAAAQPGTFSGRQFVSGIFSASKISIADFNRDSKPDLVVLHGYPNTGLVSVFLHDTGQWYEPALNFTPPSMFDEVVTADFNGDGRPDLALGGWTAGIQVYLGRGDGTFTAKAPTSGVPPNLSGLKTGDVNGDGKADLLALSNVTSGLSLWLGWAAGDGTFTGTSVRLDNTSEGNWPFDIGDFNGDHRLDVVYERRDTTVSLAVRLGNGDFTFQAAAPIEISATFVNSSWIAADVNGDTRTDIVQLIPTDLSSGRAGAARVYLAGSNGVLQGPIETAVDNSGGRGVADMDSDGKPDLLVGYRASITILRGKGDGTFLPGVPFSNYPGDTGLMMPRLRFADVDGNGRTDIVYPGPTPSVILSKGDGTVEVEVDVPSGLRSPTHLTLDSADFNRDGRPDLLAVDAGGPVDAQEASILNGLGNGSFQQGSKFKTPVTPWTFLFDTLGDFNGDGLMDIAFGGASQVAVALGKGDGTFFPLVYTSGIGNVTYLKSADFNGDQKADLLVSAGSEARIALSKGDGTFFPAPTIDVNTPVAVGDVNGDGRPDVLLRTSLSGPNPVVTVRLNHGDGTFPDTFTTDVPAMSSGAALADLNGDGKLDLVDVTTVQNSSYVEVRKGNGNGTFSAPYLTAPTAVSDLMAVGDFNGDGKADVIGKSDGNIKLYAGKGDGTLGQPLEYGTSGQLSSVVLGDFNQDGRTDLAASGSPGSLSVLLQHGAVALAPLLTIGVSHTGNFTQGQSGVFTVTVSNQAGTGPTSGTVTVTQSLSSGLTPVKVEGSGWNCTGLTCTRADALAAGASYPNIVTTVNVSVDAAAYVLNLAYVAGGGSSDASASDSASVTFASPFVDVPPSHPFVEAIALMRTHHITDGCRAEPLSYCPDDAVTRGQMAVFIIRSMMGGDTFPYPATPYFDDVPATHEFFKWIQKMKELGITNGCGTTTYCPHSQVTRGQMAVFIVRARMGATTVFNYGSTPLFVDVPATHEFFRWIQKMKQVGITQGCSETAYCPDDAVTRGQMAVFIMRGEFNLLLPAGTPRVVSVVPGVISRNQLELTLVGITCENMPRIQGVTTVSLGEGVFAGPATLGAQNSVLVYAIATGASDGVRSVVVTTGDFEAVLPNGLRIQ